MDDRERQRREAVFADAKAAVLGCRPRLAEGFHVERPDETTYVLCSSSDDAQTPVGYFEGEFLWLVDGERTVGDIIDAMSDESDLPRSIMAGKAAMAALHTHYVGGVIEEMREL